MMRAEHVKAVLGVDFFERRVYTEEDTGLPVDLTDAVVEYHLSFIPQFHGESGIALVADVNTPGSDGVVTASIPAETFDTLAHSLYHWYFFVTPLDSSPILFGWGLWELVPYE